MAASRQIPSLLFHLQTTAAIAGIAVGERKFVLASDTLIYVYGIKPRREGREAITKAGIAHFDPNPRNDIAKPEMNGTGAAVQEGDAAYKNEVAEADSAKIIPAVEAPGLDLNPVYEMTSHNPANEVIQNSRRSYLEEITDPDLQTTMPSPNPPSGDGTLSSRDWAEGETLHSEKGHSSPSGGQHSI
ncbi:hypothetical protein BGZ60DRAFT_438030 [Tricladium varicosporioides]|nr:hypothetical protein BGZ60DRAFT_438030 [Hymenoscyphus varicosporioides]